jgi:glycosyltransferase involved in cell wall biosynthesis
MPSIKTDAFLFIVGNDDIRQYAGIIKELNLENRIKHVRSVDSISAAYHAADVFIFPTLYEPFGLVITEAMASGLPVITSGTSGAAEIMEDGMDGLLLDNPRDAGMIAKRINQLIADPAFRSKLGKAASQKAASYTWDVVAEKWLSVFKECYQEGLKN